MPRLPTREELSDARKQGTINKNDRITQDVRGFVFVDDASGSRLHCEVHIGKSVRVTLLTSISISAFGEEVHVAWFALSFHPHGFQPKVDFVFRKGFNGDLPMATGSSTAAVCRRGGPINSTIGTER